MLREQEILLEMDRISEVHQQNNQYYQDTLQVAEICLNDSPNKVFFKNQMDIQDSSKTQIKHFSNLSQLSFRNFLQILEEKNEDSSEENNVPTIQTKSVVRPQSFRSDYFQSEEDSQGISTCRNSTSTNNQSNHYNISLNESREHKLSSFLDEIQRSPQNEKKDPHDFKLYPDSITQDPRTTLMIKNIPNKYTNALLKEKIHQQFKDKYDFFYLPMDYQYKCNMGYAFVNLKDKQDIIKFYNFFNGRKWDLFKSKKAMYLIQICEIKYARVQGKIELEKHIKSTNQQASKERTSMHLPQNKLLGIEEIIMRQKKEHL